jgi:hypothetical protein
MNDDKKADIPFTSEAPLTSPARRLRMDCHHNNLELLNRDTVFEFRCNDCRSTLYTFANSFVSAMRLALAQLDADVPPVAG